MKKYLMFVNNGGVIVSIYAGKSKGKRTKWVNLNCKIQTNVSPYFIDETTALSLIEQLSLKQEK